MISPTSTSFTRHSRRAPERRPASSDGPRDQVTLSGASGPKPDPLVPVKGLAVSQSGAAAPSIAQHLEELPVKFFRKKRIRWPGSSRWKEVSTDKAPELYESGKLQVDYGDGVRPLKDEQQIAILEANLKGETRLKPGRATRALIDYDCRDGNGRALSDYDAYLKLSNSEPIVVLDDGVPMGRLNSKVGYRVIPGAELDPEPLLAAAEITQRTQQHFQALPEDVLKSAPLAEPEKELMLELSRQFQAPQAAGRLRALEGSDDYRDSIRALDTLGWTQPEASIKTLTLGHQVYLRFGRKKAGFLKDLQPLLKRAQKETDVFYQQLLENPEKTLIEVFPKRGRKLKELLATEGEAEAVQAAVGLTELKDERMLERALGEGRSLTEALTCAHEFGALKRPSKRAVQVYQKLLHPDREPARRLFVEVHSRGHSTDHLDTVLEPSGRTTLEERTQLYLAVAGRVEPKAHYKLMLADLKAGHSREQAVERESEFNEACKKARTRLSSALHHRDLVGPAMKRLFHFLPPERESMRAVFLEAVAQGNLFDPAPLLASSDPLPLDERAELMGTLLDLHRPEAYYQAVVADVKTGTPVAQARARLDPFLEATQAARTYRREDRHFKSLVKPQLENYAETLSEESIPLRQLFLEALASKKSIELQVLRQPVTGVDLEQRCRLYRSVLAEEKHETLYRSMAAWINQGVAVEAAESRMEQFLAATKVGRRPKDVPETRSTALKSYNDLQSPEDEPLRSLALWLLRDQRDIGGLPELKQPVAGFSTQEKAELYKSVVSSSRPMTLDLYQVTVADMEAGRSPEAAQERTLELVEAAEQGRRSQRDDHHYERTVEPALNLYRKILAPGHEPARALLLETLRTGADTRPLDSVLEPAAGLSLEQRCEFLRYLGPDKKAPDFYHLMVTAVERGRTPEQALAMTDELQAALETARTTRQEATHHRRLVDPALKILRTALKSDCEPARALLLETMNEKKSISLLYQAVTENHSTLEHRVELVRASGGNSDLYHLGKNLGDDAVAEVTQLASALKGTQSSWIERVAKSYRKSKPVARGVLLGGLQAGHSPDRVLAVLGRVEGSLTKAEQARLAPEAVREAMAGAAVFERVEVESLLEVMAIQQEEKDWDDWGIEMTDEEVLIGDILLDRH